MGMDTHAIGRLKMTIHMTRRTMLRGMGAALALPWMESLPACRSSGQDIGQAARPDVFLVRSQRRAPADLVSQARGSAGRPARDASAALVRPRVPQLLSRPDAQHGADQRRHRRMRPRPGCGELSDRRPGLQDAGRRSRRHLGRPALRAITSATRPAFPASSWAASRPAPATRSATAGRTRRTSPGARRPRPPLTR